MTTLSDRQLFDAGLSTDVVLGFRRAMRRRPSTPSEAVEMPQHFYDENRDSRRAEFRRGVEIARAWRSLRTGAGVARRESRNRDFKELGIAYVIDTQEVRREATVFLRKAIASVDGFSLPDPEIVHDIVRSLDLTDASWTAVDRIAFYEADDENGLFSNTHPTMLRASGETWTSPEALYQSQKHSSLAIQDEIRLAPDALAAKAVAAAHRTTRRSDWYHHRTLAMVRTLVLRAEQDEAYRKALIDAEDRTIVEDTTNGHHDAFWGVVSGRGVNALGRIHMAVARAIRSGALPPRPRRDPVAADRTAS